MRTCLCICMKNRVLCFDIVERVSVTVRVNFPTSTLNDEHDIIITSLLVNSNNEHDIIITSLLVNNEFIQTSLLHYSHPHSV